ncbi:MAG: AAA family ATPase, partial [Flavobacteriales bacterium]|nr:AAA family ATPase [Flavobacteriales bacterium]
TYKSEVADKSSIFANALAKTYIEDYVESRTVAAGKTVGFIDQQLEQVKKKLTASEIQLENYRLENNIINTQQETETTLRKIAQLKIQLSNMQMNEIALDSLERYMAQNDKNFLELAPNFEAFNDLLSTELIKKIKHYQAKKKDLLLKYTVDDEKVKVVDEKIKDISSYIHESISNTANSIRLKRRELEKVIEEANRFFIGLPTKEKELVILNRNFVLNQKILNFLTEKRTEAAIAEAASISFHRIIQKAYVPTIPISPKKVLVMIVSGILGLIIGVSTVYFREFVGGKIRTREELEKISLIPVAGIVKNYKKKVSVNSEDFLRLASSLSLFNGIKKHQSILLTSTISKEGKTFITENLGSAIAALGWNVVLVDLNFKKPSLSDRCSNKNAIGMAELILEENTIDEVVQYDKANKWSIIPTGQATENSIQLMNNIQLDSTIARIKQKFDLLIIDSPATAFAAESIKLMRLSDIVYYVVKANYTKSHFLLNADLIAKEYRITNIQLLLNGVHQATNYNGNYTGSGFNYETEYMSVKDRVKRYIKYYL